MKEDVYIIDFNHDHDHDRDLGHDRDHGTVKHGKDKFNLNIIFYIKIDFNLI